MKSLYRVFLWVAACSNVATLVFIVLSIVVRLMGRSISGLDAYAGYCLASTFFLALAETFVRNEHIRVSLLLSNVPAGLRKHIEIFSLLAAIFITGYLTFFSSKMVYTSYKFKEVSQLPDATPLWIPQLSFSLGMLVFLLAQIHRLVMLIKNGGNE